MRKGLVIGGIALSLLMGCNNGGELEAERRLGEIGRSAENVFYSFIDLIAGSLGFRVTKDITKQQVGDHFNSLGTKIGEASAKLEEVAVKAAADNDKDGPLNKAIREAVDAAKGVLDKLKSHLEALKDIGDGDEKVGEVGSNSQQGVAANTETLKKVYEALKGIVELAKKEGVEDLKGSKLTLETASIGGATPQNGAKILAAGGDSSSAVGDKAAAIVAAVNGEAILDSIVKSEGKVSTIGSPTTVSTTALEFAVGGIHSNVANDATPKAAAVAGGIALRSLVKGGKLASDSSNSNQEKVTVKSVGMDASNKLLEAVGDIIKKTVKETLKKAKDKIDEARKPKALGN